MKVLFTIIAVANAAVLKAPSAKAALKLRGGLGGVDPEQVAKGLTLLVGAQSVMSVADQGKVCEMYEMADTGVTQFFIGNGGALMLGTAWSAWKMLNGGDAAASVAEGLIASILYNLKDLSSDTTGSLGWGQAPKYMPLAVNVLFYAGLTGRLDFLSAGDSMKYMSWWLLANGVMMYFAPDKAMEMWQASYSGKAAAAENAMTKMFGSWIAGTGAFVYALNDGKSAVEAILQLGRHHRRYSRRPFPRQVGPRRREQGEDVGRGRRRGRRLHALLNQPYALRPTGRGSHARGEGEGGPGQRIHVCTR